MFQYDPVIGLRFQCHCKPDEKTIEWTDRRSWLGNNEDADVLKFRQLFVDKVQSNDHYQMLSGIPSVDLNPGGEYSQEKCAARFPKPLPYLRPKFAISLTLFMT